MYKVHDLEFMRRLRDDLQTKVIPSYKVEIEEDVGKLRRKLEAECPPADFEKAQSLLEEGISKVKEERKTLLAEKRSLSKKRKAPEQDQPAPKKPKQSAAPPPPWG